MSIRRLFAMLVALAVLLAPAVARAGGAFAAPDHEQMMEHTGHCQMPVGGSADHGKSAGKGCCIWMCAAVSVEPAAVLKDEAVPSTPAAFAIPTIHIGYLGEIATPPPRRV